MTSTLNTLIHTIDFLHLGWAEVYLPAKQKSFTPVISEYLGKLIAINADSSFSLNDTSNSIALIKPPFSNLTIEAYYDLIKADTSKTVLLKDIYPTYFMIGRTHDNVPKCIYLSTQIMHIAKILKSVIAGEEIDVASHGFVRALCKPEELNDMRRILQLLMPFHEKQCYINIIDKNSLPKSA